MTGKCLIVLFAAAAILLPQDKDKDKARFEAGTVADYQTKQTVDQVTVAASPFLNDEETHRAFGKKLNPNKEGILPVLVVIENGRGEALFLENMKIELLTPDRQRVEATPASDVRYLRGGGRPKVSQGPIPGQQRVSMKKNPLAAWEIEGRAFSARMLPPKEAASGFFYFRAPYRAGSQLYVTGLREAATGKELFYFEIPLDQK
ncbi:MAG TPA: hypothetical protein VN428_20400 [Bryobacteraceae bacterium]|nr:hypothetical protein [Bryobacteraceae bacterium]